MNELKTYVVTVQEVHGRRLRVRASSESGAIDVASRGGAGIEDLGLQFDYRLYWGVWKVEEEPPMMAT